VKVCSELQFKTSPGRLFQMKGAEYEYALICALTLWSISNSVSLQTVEVWQNTCRLWIHLVEHHLFPVKEGCFKCWLLGMCAEFLSVCICIIAVFRQGIDISVNGLSGVLVSGKCVFTTTSTVNGRVVTTRKSVFITLCLSWSDVGCRVCFCLIVSDVNKAKAWSFQASVRTRPRRRRIPLTYGVEFPWSRSRRQTC